MMWAVGKDIKLSEIKTPGEIVLSEIKTREDIMIWLKQQRQKKRMMMIDEFPGMLWRPRQYRR